MTYVNKGSVTAIGIIFPALVGLCLALRLRGWLAYSRKLEVDDVLVVPAALLTIAAGVAMVIGAQMDIIGGHSLPVITTPEQHKLGKFEYAFWMGHVLAMGFIKLTLLFLFRRIFKGRAYITAFDCANWTLITLVTLWTIAFFFADAFACGTTPSKAWTSLYSLRNYCIDTFAMLVSNAVFSWVLDLAIFVEPLLMIGSLNMNSRRKLQASLVFLCSAFAVIAGLLRMIVWIQIEIQDITRPTTKILGTDLITADQTGIISIVLFWTYVEIGVGFVVACLPPSARLIDEAFGPIVHKLRSFSSLIPSSIRGRESQSGGTKTSEETQRSWPTFQRKVSSSRQHEDTHELVTAQNV